MAESRLVRVADWSNSRRVVVDGPKVYLEVALSHNHCPTCSERVRFVTQQLSRRNVQYSWTYSPFGPGSYLVLDAPGKDLGVADYLAGLLDIPVTLAR